MNLPGAETEIVSDVENKLIVAREKAVGINWEIGVKTWKGAAVSDKQGNSPLNNLCSLHGKRLQGRGVCVCVADSRVVCHLVDATL